MRASGTTPPYNVKIDGHVSGLGSTKHREFASRWKRVFDTTASGEMTEAEFTHFLKDVFANLAGHAVDGAIHFVCMDWRHVGEVLAAATPAYSELKNICVWAKTNGGVIAERCYASTARSTARSTRWSSSLRAAPRLISTTSNSAATASSSSSIGRRTCSSYRRLLACHQSRVLSAARSS